MQVSDLPPENFYIKDVFSHFFTDLPKVNHLILNSAIIDLLWFRLGTKSALSL